jgi:hypothetical protein
LGPQPAGSSPAPAMDTDLQSTVSVAPAVDRANIRPLDVPAALQILIAEVRASFDVVEGNVGSEADILADSPSQGARAVVQLFLQTIPMDAPTAETWTAAVANAEGLLQSGLDRGIAAIAAWREVPPIVIDAAKEAHALIFSAVGEDSQNPIWLRPEWAGLAPRLERYWRRRRLARRGLTDPDPIQRNVDDDPR